MIEVNLKFLPLCVGVMYILPLLLANHKAARLGIPSQLWRLVDCMIQRGALQSAEVASNLFPPVEASTGLDALLDEETHIVLR